MDITCCVIFTGAKMINGRFLRDGGSCHRYRKWIRGSDSKEGTGFEPATEFQFWYEDQGRERRTFVTDEKGLKV